MTRTDNSRQPKPPRRSRSVTPIRATANSDTDRIARNSSLQQNLETSPPPSMSEAAEGPRTGADAPRKTGVRFPVPQAGKESDNQKARESRVLGSSRMLRILRGPPTSSAPPIPGPAPGSFEPARRGQARREKTKSPETSKPVRQGQVKSAQPTQAQRQPTPRWTGSLEHTHPPNASKPHPHTHVGSSRGATQRAPTHQANQARSSLSPRPVKNQTIKKRGSSEGPRPGPLSPPGEGKRVANQ